MSVCLGPKPTSVLEYGSYGLSSTKSDLYALTGEIRLQESSRHGILGVGSTRGTFHRLAGEGGVAALEVQAKSSIPDERTFQRLLSATALAGFSLEEPWTAELHARFLDTADGAFRAGGYACRICRQDSQPLSTLKGLGAGSGAVHHRTEQQVELSEALSPRDWPQSAALDLALHLSSAEPLFLLFEIHQTRHRRLLWDGYRSVTKLNLDRVRPRQGDDMALAFLELEVELLPNGSEQDLDRPAIEFQEGWVLVPQVRSRFEQWIRKKTPRTS